MDQNHLEMTNEHRVGLIFRVMVCGVPVAVAAEEMKLKLKNSRRIITIYRKYERVHR